MADQTLIPSKWTPVTPSDTVPVVSNLGLYVGTGGNVVAKGIDGVSATFVVSSGQYLSGRFYYVMAATTASDIVSLS
jgi:hypothetical protein